MKITAEDCRTCGACCVADGDGGDVLTYGYAHLTDKDVARLSPRVRSQLQEILFPDEDTPRLATRAKKLPSGAYACQFLRGTPGQQCSCSIYETRPVVCQTFRVGGQLCRAARRSLSVADGRGGDA